MSKKLTNANPVGVVVEIILEEETYDRTDELESFYGEYVIQNGLTQTPFKLILNIKKINKTHSVRGEAKSYYFFGSPSFNMQSMNLTISPIELLNKTISKYVGAQVASRIYSRYKSGFIFNILSENTLTNANALNIMMNNALWNYNSDWYREIKSRENLKIKRNKFFIDLDWTINWRDSQFCCYTELPQTNILNLKKYKTLGQNHQERKLFLLKFNNLFK